MAGIRMTGLASGLDTQSLVGELSKAYQKKVDNAKKAQTKAEWKKAAWSSLNTKLQNFYKGALSTFKTTGTYNAKTINGTLTGGCDNHCLCHAAEFWHYCRAEVLNNNFNPLGDVCLM